MAMPLMCATRILPDRTAARKRALPAAKDSIECEADDGENAKDLLAELLNSIEFGHDLDQSIEEVISAIRRGLDRSARF